MFTRFGSRQQRQASQSHTLRRAMRRVAMVLALAVAVPVVSASAADATIYNGAGNFGPYLTSNGSCESRMFGNQRVVSMSAAPPRVFARDVATGAGNDSAWVHYAAYVMNEATGAVVVQPTTWSAWAMATDVVPATWMYADSFQVAGDPVNYRIHYVIEWWTSTARTAWIADQLESYRLTDQTSVDRGTSSACSYLMGMYL